MKTILTALLLLITSVLVAQEYTYTITPEAGDSTFTLDIITVNGPNNSSIQRTSNLDTIELQRILYSRVESEREIQARQQVAYFESLRNASTLLQALNSVNLNNYIVHQREKHDSTFVANQWALRINGVTTTYNSQYVENLPTRLRTQDTNDVYATIIPFSSNNIRLNFINPLADGSGFVDLYGRGSNRFIGETNTGQRVIFIRQ